MDKIWEAKKQHLGLPLSFTKYYISNGTLYIKSGLLSQNIEQIKLYKIIDINVHYNIIDMLFRQGSIEIVSRDKTLPTAYLINIPNAVEFVDMLNDLVEKERERVKVKSVERSEDGDYVDD